MVEWVKIVSPFEDRPTRAELRTQLRDHLTKGIIKVKNETHQMAAGTYTYTLEHSPYDPSATSMEIDGTYQNNRITFTYDVDYTISGRVITFDVNQRYPDSSSLFYVTYHYQGTKSGVTDEAAVSIASIITEVMGNAGDDFYDEQERVHYAAYSETATGENLERIGVLVGARRVQAAQAVGTLQLIFSRTATGGSPISVTANTRFSTKETATQGAIYFETTTGSDFTSGDNGIIGIQALEGGVNGKVGINTITVIVDSITDVDSATNLAATTGGVNDEEDDDYRNRIPLAKESKGKTTENAMVFDLTSLAGIASVTPKNRWRGNGTADIFVVASTLPMSAALKAQVQAAIDSGTAFSADISLSEPKVINAWVNAQLERTTNSDSGNVFNSSSGETHNYLVGLGLGERLIPQQFLSSLLTPADAIQILSWTVAETGGILYAEPDQVIRPGYRVTETGSGLSIFSEAEIITVTGDYTTGFKQELGVDTLDSGLTVYAYNVTQITAVWDSGGDLFTAGTDYTLTTGDLWQHIEWISGGSYPTAEYSVAYVYNAIQISVTNTGSR